MRKLWSASCREGRGLSRWRVETFGGSGLGSATCGRVARVRASGVPGAAAPGEGQAATPEARPMEWNNTSRASSRAWTASKSLTAWAGQAIASSSSRSLRRQWEPDPGSVENKASHPRPNRRRTTWDGLAADAHLLPGPIVFTERDTAKGRKSAGFSGGEPLCRDKTRGRYGASRLHPKRINRPSPDRDKTRGRYGASRGRAAPRAPQLEFRPAGHGAHEEPEWTSPNCSHTE